MAPSLRGNVVAKANWLLSHRRFATASSTRPELVAGALEALFARQSQLRVLFSGSAALGCSARHQARRARGRVGPLAREGYLALEAMFRGQVTVRPTDEAQLYRYQLSVGRRMSREQRDLLDAELDVDLRYWDRVVAGYELYHADAVVLFPKLKTSVLAGGLCGAVDLQGVGFLRGVDRLDGHNRHNARRVVDMLEVTDPDLVITDAIEVGFGGGTMTQSGHHLGLLVVADNAVAHDAVCARLLGLDPQQNPQLRLAAERGFGSIEEADIEIGGDVDLQRAALQVVGFGPHVVGRVDDFSKRFERYCGAALPLDIHCGGFYEEAAGAGVLLDWLYSSFDHPRFRERMKRWPRCSVFVGEVQERPRNERIYLVGDRAIASFAAQTDFMQPALKLPLFIQRQLAGSFGLYRYRLKGGGRGWVTAISGNPPSRQAISWAFLLGSLGRISPPLLGALPSPVEACYQLFARLLSKRRNRHGIRLVHARKMARTLRRPWRLGAGAPVSLALRDDLEQGN